MQVKHRRNHFRVWVVLAILIAIGFLSALILRSPVPIETQHPGAVLQVIPVNGPDTGNFAAVLHQIPVFGSDTGDIAAALQLTPVFGPDAGNFSAALQLIPVFARDVGNFPAVMGPAPSAVSAMTG